MVVDHGEEHRVLSHHLLEALPVLLLILVGVVVRETGTVDRSSRLMVTRLVYYVTIPAAIFTSIARSEIRLEALWLPLIGFVLPCVLTGLMYGVTPDLSARRRERGVLLTATVALVVFAYPFFELFFGTEGLARIALFDIGNALFAGSVALWLAQAFGCQADDRPALEWGRLFTSPILVAAVLGVTVSILGAPLRGPLWDMLEHIKGANTPLAMIAVGMFLEPKASHGGLIARYVAVRMVLGGLLGWAAAVALGMGGLDVVAACVGSAMPAGTTALVYAGAEGLDTELAASLVSGSLVVGAVIITLLPHLLAGVYL